MKIELDITKGQLQTIVEFLGQTDDKDWIQFNKMIDNPVDDNWLNSAFIDLYEQLSNEFEKVNNESK